MELATSAEQAGEIERLEKRNCELSAELERVRRELAVTHELTAVMHASLDTGEVQEQVLRLVTEELGFGRAVLARFDPQDGVLTGWLTRTASGTAGQPGPCIPEGLRIKVESGSGAISDAVLSAEPMLAEGRALYTLGDDLGQLKLGSRCAVLPLIMRGRLLGVLLVDGGDSGRPISENDLTLLANIASQSSLVLGSLQLCIDRAQRLAVEGERSRIAMEIHDTVSQHLYGIAYTLDASIKLLPKQADEVRQRLVYLLPQVHEANAAIRQTIFDLWPEEFDARRFADDLQAYVRQMDPEGTLDLQVSIDPHFGTLPVPMRRQLHFVAQEALANVVKHAGASSATVILHWNPVELTLTVEDDGHGFDMTAYAPASVERRSFGLEGMRERAQALGGALRVESAPGRGTRLAVRVPLGVN